MTQGASQVDNYLLTLPTFLLLRPQCLPLRLVHPESRQSTLIIPFYLFAGSDKSQAMLALSISPNRRYLAISELVQEKPIITIYELSAIPCRKRKILSNFDFPVQRFTSMAFSPDSKYLLTQTSPPESNLVYWLWEKQKVMAIVKTDSQNNTVYQVPPNITSIVQII